MTISATTGVPSSPRSRSVFKARIDWSKRMLWLTPSLVPVSSQTCDHLDRLRQGERDRLLGEDALDVRPARRLTDYLELLVRRVGDVDDLHFRVVEQFLPGVVDLRDVVRLGGGLGVLGRSRGDRDGAETGLVVGRQMDVPHDEPGADAADPVVGLRRAGPARC